MDMYQDHFNLLNPQEETRNSDSEIDGDVESEEDVNGYTDHTEEKKTQKC